MLKHISNIHLVEEIVKFWLKFIWGITKELLEIFRKKISLWKILPNFDDFSKKIWKYLQIFSLRSFFYGKVIKFQKVLWKLHRVDKISRKLLKIITFYKKSLKIIWYIKKLKILLHQKNKFPKCYQKLFKNIKYEQYNKICEITIQFLNITKIW